MAVGAGVSEAPLEDIANAHAGAEPRHSTTAQWGRRIPEERVRPESADWGKKAFAAMQEFYTEHNKDFTVGTKVT